LVGWLVLVSYKTILSTNY